MAICETQTSFSYSFYLYSLSHFQAALRSPISLKCKSSHKILAHVTVFSACILYDKWNWEVISVNRCIGQDSGVSWFSGLKAIQIALLLRKKGSGVAS